MANQVRIVDLKQQLCVYSTTYPLFVRFNITNTQKETHTYFGITEMKPKRPDSAKSRVTQLTYDTDKLSESKLSQTTTSNLTFQIQKKDDFKEYLKEKQKDPRFKKLHKATLAEIPQAQVKPELNKLNSKPFEKRNSSRVLESSTSKRQEADQTVHGKWTVNEPSKKKENKKQEMGSSKSFAEKNRQKLNSVNSALRDATEKPGQNKVNLRGFKVNVPGRKSPKEAKMQENNEFLASPQKQNTPKKEEEQKRPITSGSSKGAKQSAKKTEEEIRREEEMLEISRFINEVEMKNITNYPDGYEEFVERNESRVEDIQKINIADFMNEPTESDYAKIQKRIQQNEKYFTAEQEQEALSESRSTLKSAQNSRAVEQSSIDLDKMIDGSEEPSGIGNDSEVFLSSISSQDLKQRNLFLTEILKGRITQDDIQKLEDMEKSQIKMMKLEEPPKQDDQFEKVEVVEINMMKKSNRLLERNKIEASGQIYRECDYLSEENKQRLEKLLSGEVQQSPFEVSEWDQFAMKRIDQGIRIYREFTASIEGRPNIDSLPQDLLPKDPQLRKQAEKKILKERIDSVNKRLRDLDELVINQSKIKEAISTYSESTKVSDEAKRLIEERKAQYEGLQQKSKQISELLNVSEAEKAEMKILVAEMQQQYREFEKQKETLSKMTTQEFRVREQQNLESTKNRLKELENDLGELEKGTNKFQKYGEELSQHLQVLRQLDSLHISNAINCGNYSDQTQESLDIKFNQMAESKTNDSKFENYLSINFEDYSS